MAVIPTGSHSSVLLYVYERQVSGKRFIPALCFWLFCCLSTQQNLCWIVHETADRDPAEKIALLKRFNEESERE